MNQRIICKTLAVAVIILFLGVGIQPAFAVEISNDTTSEKVEDCNCQVDDNYDIVRIKSLLNRAERSLNRVETLTKLIPILSKDNPELIEDCQELSEKINTFREMNEEIKSTKSDWEYPIICVILHIMMFAISIMYNVKSLITILLYIIFQDIPIIANFMFKIDEYFFTKYLKRLDHIVNIMVIFDCI